MSKKKNKKKALLSLIEPKKEKVTENVVAKEPLMPQLAHTLFQTLHDKFNILNSIIDDKFEIVAFTDNESDPDNVCCYTISPASNKNVVVYVDDKKIEPQLDKKVLKAEDVELGFLTANIINYLNVNYTALIA